MQKEEKIDDLGCEFCGHPATRMFKAPKKPIIITWERRTFKAIKPYWLACLFCASCLEANNLDELRQRVAEAVQSMAAGLSLPQFADKQKELKEDIVRASFKLLGLETIRKALTLPSKPIAGKANIAAANLANTAVFDALKDATGSTDRAIEAFESLEGSQPN